MMTVRAVEKGTGRVRTGRIGGGSGSGGVAPAFQADFTGLTSLPSWLSFSRATAGTYLDASGVLQTAAIDAPRFDHAWSGSAWVATGLMDEEQRTNYAHPSIPGSGWQGGGGTFTANFGVAPDGTTTATQIVCGDGTLTDRSVYLDLTAASCPAVSTGAAWVKGTAGEKVYLILYSTDYSNRVLITFDGTWQRIPTAPSSSAPQYIFFDTSTTGGADPTNGLPAVTFLAWHVDVQGGSSITSTIPTTTAAVTRSADIAQLTGAAATAAIATTASIIAEVSDRPDTGQATRFVGSSNGGTALAVSGGKITLYNLTVAVSSSVLTWPATHRGAVSYDSSGISLSADGGAVVTSSDTHSSGMIDAYLGSNGGTTDFLNGHFRSIAIYTSRLSDADLQAKSVVGAAF